MYARNVSFGLKPNMRAEFIRTLESHSSLAPQTKGLQGRNHDVQFRLGGYCLHQPLGEQG